MPSTALRGRRFALPALAALIACLLLAACGSSDHAAGTTTASASAAGGGFPTTIRSTDGSATIERRPERVVALDFDSADAALALGVTPVAIARVSYAPGGVQPWTRAALHGARPQLIPTDAGVSVEQVAALHPDLILAEHLHGLGDVYDELSQIAPVVGYKRGEVLDTWQEATARAGQALGRSAQARALIAGVRRDVDAARAAHPEFAGRTVAFFNLVGTTAWLINGRDDFSIRFLEDLGFRLSPTAARQKGAMGRAQISPERYDLLGADVVMGTSPTPGGLDELARHPVFSRVISRDAWLPIDLSPATAMAFPSALSVRWALDALVPRLAAATSGR